MKQQQIFIVDYAYGFHADTCEVDYVCVLRSKAALRALKKYPLAKIILSAGMKQSTGNCGPLAGMMREYLLTQGVAPDVILESALGEDTLSETKAAHDIITRLGGGAVICATSAYHIPRVWCIWVFGFSTLPVKFYNTSLAPKFAEHLRELVKIPLDAVRALRYRFA